MGYYYLLVPGAIAHLSNLKAYSNNEFETSFRRKTLSTLRIYRA